MSRRCPKRETMGERYVPAAGRHRLTGLYDPVVAVVMRERRFRDRLVDEVLFTRPRTILDIGCGTGTLAIMLARRAPGIEVTGLDGDPEILQRAARKALRSGAAVRWLMGMARAIPLADDSVECVVSSLVFHHLQPEAKVAALREIARVLRPDGRLMIADWGRPQDFVMRVAFLALQLLDGFSTTRQHAAGEFPRLVADAGFDVAVTGQMRTILGTLEFLTARPAAGAPGPVTSPGPDPMSS